MTTSRLLLALVFALSLSASLATASPVQPAQGPPAKTHAPAEDRDLSSVVYACVNRKGELMSAWISRGSGIAEIDEAALKVARAAKFSPASDKNGKPRRKSCLHFKVKFVIKDGEPVPVGDAPPPA